ncbi:MAG: HEAT repeat domain-containing protein [Verrucomicrobia bacterium]|nr:HEAT repeat domain-containing protein [Verrucomicrobiota bacterium]
MKALALFAVLGLALSSVRVCGQTASADPYEGLAKFKFGDSRLPLAMIEDQIRKSSPAEYKVIETKLLILLNAPETPKDAKRYICRWLAVVGSVECVPAVVPLLTDDDLSHPARMALEPMASPAAGAALRDVLPKVRGRLRSGLIGSIGVRRDAEAVSALASLAKDDDAVVANAAIMALGAIGTESAAQTLAGLQVSPSLYRALARARITAAGHLKNDGANPLAVAIYRDLMQPAQPQFIRIAALKGLIGALPQAEAVRLVTEMVQGEDASMREATVAAYAMSTDVALQNAVASALPSMKSSGQLILLGVLADLPDVAARLPVLTLVGNEANPAVRAAAIDCLGRHGEAADVPMLVRLAGTGQGAVAVAAHKTLDRLGKPGVDEALIGLIDSPNATDRATVLGVLASRRTMAALPTLVRLVGGTDASLAAEAAKALGVMGQDAQLTALVATIVATESAQLRAACEEAAHAICTRAQDKTGAAGVVLGALGQAQQPPARATLLRLLGYTPGPAPLAAVVKALGDSDSEVRQAAFRTLVGWPDATAVPRLVEVAQRAPDSSDAIVALRDGCLRLAAMEEVPIAERLSAYRSVLEVARRSEEKRQAISGLSEIPSFRSLDLLKGCGQDAALKNEAIPAAIRVAKELGAANHTRAVAALTELKQMTDKEDLRKEVDDAIKSLQNAGQTADGSILAWMFSGPYRMEGKTGAELFDLVLDPEKAGSKVDWRPVGQAAINKTGLVDLSKLMGGDERVAYLRTQINSERDQEARLEIGSDDGVKVWLNDKIVHANNVIRGCTPGEDKFKVMLNHGVNRLVLKVTQGGGEWSACCRLRGPDGAPLENATVGGIEE